VNVILLLKSYLGISDSLSQLLSNGL